MTPGQIAAVVAAAAFVVLVLLVAVVVVKLSRTLDEATIAIRKAHENTDPIFTEASTTLTHVNTQLERVDGVTSNVRTLTGNASALSSLFTATLGGPLVKTAAVSYGVSRAIKARRAAAGAPQGKHSRRARKGRRK
ncbi:DUF948 domain-containing protein [Sciscionella marina]|uniref:DUF948 domain-containing protein n=1 Tax=Sciscionella marina TaxID=508770 RepID=UPI00036FB231|nr:DUF948 domain-containing protein [Sciscionella marina]